MRLTEANQETQMFFNPHRTEKRWSQKQMPLLASLPNTVCGLVETGVISQNVS